MLKTAIVEIDVDAKRMRYIDTRTRKTVLTDQLKDGVFECMENLEKLCAPVALGIGYKIVSLRAIKGR